MAQLFFRFGSVNSGKSIDLLKVAYNYEERGDTILLMTSALDNRDGFGKISSRIGMSRDAIAIDATDSLVQLLKDSVSGEDISIFDCILVDEAQFLTRLQVENLSYIVDTYDIPVMCFGLKNDFQNKLFEGSEALLIHADKLEEVKTLCWYCRHKATMNLRISDGKPVYMGETVEIGGNEAYKPVCRRHYYEPNI